MDSCEHKNFEANVSVGRLAERDAVRAEAAELAEVLSRVVGDNGKRITLDELLARWGGGGALRADGGG